jgi:putative ABC transport system substrate-binding protein
MTKEVAVLGNPNTENTKIFIEDVEMAAKAIGVKISVLNAVKDGEIDDAFASLSERRVDAVLVVNDTLFTTQRSKIAVLAARNAIPAIYTTREFTEAGGLMSYGPSLIDVYRQAGVYAGRIIRGEKPIDLPILQPIKFELVINLKTLKALGFTLPPILFAIADEVIE